MAVTRLTLHIVYKKNRRQALALLNKNTVLAREAKGFVARHVYFSRDDPLKGYSITTFKTRKDMETFHASPERPPLEMKGKARKVYLKAKKGDVLLFSHTESTLYDEVVP